MMTLRSRLIFTAACLFLPPMEGCKRAKQLAAQAETQVGVTSGPSFNDAVKTHLSSDHLEELRWPDISDMQQPASTFYDNRGGTLAWSKEGKPTRQAQDMMQAFSNARQRGLEPEDYDASKWQARVAKLSSDDGKVLFDMDMTVDTARFLNAIHMGRTDPQSLAFGIKSSGKQLDLPNVLESKVVNSSDIDTTLTGFEPQGAQYKALKTALQHYLDLAAQDHTSELPDPAKASIALNPGYPALDALIQKLRLMGDLSGSASTSTSAASSASAPSAPAQPLPTADLGEVTDALKRFQHRHGLTEDGKLSHDTVIALNTPMSTRAAEISDAMERWRWLDDEYQKPAVLVNLPEFELRAFEGDDETFRMRVVDGQSSKDEHHTPMIADHMKYLVFRPYWNVPVDIAKKEIVPHMQANSGYLSSHNYEVVNGKGEEQAASIASIEHGGVMVREKPGPTNSLGLVKFMFPNQFNVYLHDTNSHSLFQRMRRDYSHGCVRIQDPPKLAEWLLRGNSKWDADSIHEAMNDETANNKTVSLGKPVPIVLFYGTAYVDAGEVHFFKDLYGYDADMEELLKKGPPYPHKPQQSRAEASV